MLDYPPQSPCWALKYGTAHDQMYDQQAYFLLLDQVTQHKGTASDTFRRFGIAKVRMDLPGENEGERKAIKVI